MISEFSSARGNCINLQYSWERPVLSLVLQYHQVIILCSSASPDSILNLHRHHNLQIHQMYLFSPIFLSASNHQQGEERQSENHFPFQCWIQRKPGVLPSRISSQRHNMWGVKDLHVTHSWRQYWRPKGGQKGFWTEGNSQICLDAPKQRISQLCIFQKWLHQWSWVPAQPLEDSLLITAPRPVVSLHPCPPTPIFLEGALDEHLQLAMKSTAKHKCCKQPLEAAPASQPPTRRLPALGQTSLVAREQLWREQKLVCFEKNSSQVYTARDDSNGKDALPHSPKTLHHNQ